jgi:thymidylate synthase
LLALKKDIPEIPKSRLYVNRPELEKIFSERILLDKQKRQRKIGEAVEKYGYTQRTTADPPGRHFTQVRQIISKRTSM